MSNEALEGFDLSQVEVDEEQFNRETRKRHFITLALDQDTDAKLSRLANLNLSKLLELAIGAVNNKEPYPIDVLIAGAQSSALQLAARVKMRSLMYPLVAGAKKRPTKIVYTVNVAQPGGPKPGDIGTDAQSPNGVPMAETPPPPVGEDDDVRSGAVRERADGGSGVQDASAGVGKGSNAVETCPSQWQANASTALVPMRGQPPPAETPPAPATIAGVLDELDGLGEDDE